jgi:hypothetical protein
MEPSRKKKYGVDIAFMGVLAFAYWRGHRESPGMLTGDAAALGWRFVERAHDAHMDFQHRSSHFDPKIACIEPHVSGVGAAVSVADADGDGWMDVYVVTNEHGASNALFRNKGDGTFEEVAARAGLAELNHDGEGCSMGSVWGDWDNDGKSDVFVYKWGRSQLFHNDGDLSFRDVTAEAGLGQWRNTNCAVWLDYDRDGLLDLYVCGYFRDDVDLWKLASTRIMQESFEFAHNGGHNRLYRNLGGGHFEDVTERMHCDSTRWTFACVSADFDDDGWNDLYLANDYGSEELFLNRGGETFELQESIGLEDKSKSGMCVALGDLTNEARAAVFVTNISEKGFLFQGNNLRLNYMKERGRFLDKDVAIAKDCGWAWGSQFGDFDDDGYQDLFVVNGFISADRTESYWYDMGKVAGGLGAIFEDATAWPPIGNRSLSGYQRSRVLHNQEGRGFTDVAEVVGVTDLLDGRAVAVADLFNRGRLDVLVANQKGPLLLYANERESSAHWIGLDLVGTKSNRSAIGAKVVVEFGPLRQVQFTTSFLGFSSQNDPRLHFGLGAHARADSVTIRWPNGELQELGPLEADRLHRIVEP